MCLDSEFLSSAQSPAEGEGAAEKRGVTYRSDPKHHGKERADKVKPHPKTHLCSSAGAQEAVRGGGQEGGTVCHGAIGAAAPQPLCSPSAQWHLRLSPSGEAQG